MKKNNSTHELPEAAKAALIALGFVSLVFLLAYLYWFA